MNITSVMPCLEQICFQITNESVGIISNATLIASNTTAVNVTVANGIFGGLVSNGLQEIIVKVTNVFASQLFSTFGLCSVIASLYAIHKYKYYKRISTELLELDVSIRGLNADRAIIDRAIKYGVDKPSSTIKKKIKKIRDRFSNPKMSDKQIDDAMKTQLSDHANRIRILSHQLSEKDPYSTSGNLVLCYLFPHLGILGITSFAVNFFLIYNAMHYEYTCKRLLQLCPSGGPA